MSSIKNLPKRFGLRHSEITKKKISLGNKGKLIGRTPWNKGKKLNYPVWNKGKPYPQVSGENNVNWKGGVSKDPDHKKKMRIKNKEEKAGRVAPEQCEVCGAIGRICFDHDHNTGKFRGWICIRCNAALGMAKDSSELLLRLSEYLKKNQ